MVSVYHSAIIKITAALVLTDIVAWAYQSPIVLSVIRMGTLTIVIAAASRRERSISSAAPTSPASGLPGLLSTTTPLTPGLLRLLLQCSLLLAFNGCSRPSLFSSCDLGSMTDSVGRIKILHRIRRRIRGRLKTLHLRTIPFTRGRSGIPLLHGRIHLHYLYQRRVLRPL